MENPDWNPSLVMDATARRADETANLVAGYAPITLEVTKEAVRRIRQTLSRDEGEYLILRAYMSEDFREGWMPFSVGSRPAKGRWSARGCSLANAHEQPKCERPRARPNQSRHD
jgi:hypothetical protein